MEKLLIIVIFTAISLVTAKEVNVYSHRHYDADKKLYKIFTEKTGIKVNVLKAKADQLINKLEIEGKKTPADILITVDAGRLYRAKSKGLLQPISSKIIESNIPKHLRDSENEWIGLTKRARILAFQPDKVSENELKSYEDLANPKWKDKILIRSSSNIYNQSLLASIIANDGKEKAKNWVKGVLKNMARSPKGNDRDQMKGVVAGIGDIAIVNTYYLGKMINSKNVEEKKVAQKLKIFFPNQNGRGTHINISGAGVVKYSKNRENAIKLLEFLTSNEAQRIYAEANYEYPANPNVEWSELLKSWGKFKEDNIDLELLGKLNNDAVKLFDEYGWK